MTRRQLAAAAAALLVAVAVGSLASASPKALPLTSTGKAGGGSVVVIGTGGLSWSDVSQRTTPALWSMLRDGSTAAMTVHSVHANTCPVDGWLTLSAGEQAADPRGGQEGQDGNGSSAASTSAKDARRPPCNALPAGMRAGKVPHWDEYVAAAKGTRFDASLGLLGDQVASHGRCIQAVGPGAALGAARGNGIVDRYQPYGTANLAAAMTTCPVTLVDVGVVRDPADADPDDEARPATTRAQQVATIDLRIASVLKAAPSGTDVLLASLADAGVTERLRMAAVVGPGFGAGTLESASTRTPGLLQLADLTPTILAHLGIPRPSSLGGTPLRFIPANQNSDESANVRLRAMLDSDDASYNVHGVVEPFFYAYGILQLVVYLSATLLWRRGCGTGAQRRRLLLGTGRFAVVAATIPVSTFLANLLPWWRFSVPLVSAVASVALFATALSVLALLGPWRRRRLGPLVIVCATTVLVLAIDVMSGSRLQHSSLLGDQPLVGGRFYGMGNVSFALFGTATLLLCTAVGNHLLTLARPRYAAGAVAVIGLGAVIVDASPMWGSDLGGPTALLPGVVLLVLMILQIRLTPRRTLAVGGGIGAVIIFVGLLDWLRPAESRSHLGKFVQTTLDGGAWDILVRKLEQNVTLLLGNPLALLIPLGLVLFTFLLARPDYWAAAPMRRSFADVPLLRAGLIAVMVMWVIGFVLNDSGVAIPAIGAMLTIPLVIAIALRALADRSPTSPVTDRAARRRR